MKKFTTHATIQEAISVAQDLGSRHVKYPERIKNEVSFLERKIKPTEYYVIAESGDIFYFAEFGGLFYLNFFEPLGGSCISSTPLLPVVTKGDQIDIDPAFSVKGRVVEKSQESRQWAKATGHTHLIDSIDAHKLA